MLIFDPAANGPGVAPSVIDVQLTDASTGEFTWSTYNVVNEPVAAQSTNGLLSAPAQYSANLELVSSVQSTNNPIYDPRVASPAYSDLGTSSSSTPIEIFQAYPHASVPALAQLGALAARVTPSYMCSAPGVMGGKADQQFSSGALAQGPFSTVFGLPGQPNTWACLITGNGIGGPIIGPNGQFSDSANMRGAGILTTTNYGVAWQVKCLLQLQYRYPQVVMDTAGNLYLLILTQTSLQVLVGNIGTVGWTLVHTITLSDLTGAFVQGVLIPAVNGGAVLVLNTTNSAGYEVSETAYYYEGTAAPQAYSLTFFSSLPTGFVSWEPSAQQGMLLYGIPLMIWQESQSNSSQVTLDSTQMLAFYPTEIVNLAGMYQASISSGLGYVGRWKASVAPLNQPSGVAQMLVSGAQLYPSSGLSAGMTPSPI